MLVVVTLFSVSIALPVGYAVNKWVERRSVLELVKLGGQHGGLHPFDKLEVWYEDELKWNAQENRFELDNSAFEATGLKARASEILGRGFFSSPCAIVVNCELNQEIVDRIGKFPTIRQVWSWGTDDHEITPEELRNVFPKMNVADVR